MRAVTVVHYVSMEQVRQLRALPCFHSAFQPWALLMYQTSQPASLLQELRRQWQQRRLEAVNARV